jgi:hypothetical protein
LWDNDWSCIVEGHGKYNSILFGDFVSRCWNVWASARSGWKGSAKARAGVLDAAVVSSASSW